MAKNGNTPRHRVRLGLAGLGTVVLLVLSATLMVRPQQDSASHATAQEPLALLGLVPASSRQNSSTSR